MDPAIFSPNPLYFESLLSAVLAFSPAVIYRSFLQLCLLVFLFDCVHTPSVEESQLMTLIAMTSMLQRCS